MFAKVINIISIWSIPFVILIIIVYGYLKGVKVYDAFVEGAKDGFATAIKVIPFLVAMLVAIGIFRASGAMELLIKILTPITKLISIPSEIVPMALMRPLSGGGAQGLMIEIFKAYGPDSLIGRIAATMMGSTETTLYVLAVYYGSIAIKNTRHSLHAGLLADLAGILTSVFVVKMVFGN